MAKKSKIVEAVGTAAGSGAQADAKQLAMRIEQAMGDAANEVRRAGGSVEEQREAMTEARRRVVDENREGVAT